MEPPDGDERPTYHRLQVAGCRLQVAASLESSGKDVSRLQVAGCRLQVAGCRLQVAASLESSGKDVNRIRSQ
jgi:ATP phosphoribosyltransferase